MDSKNYINLNPMGIENDSMQIISKELSHLKIEPEFDRIVKRIIHTTADFEYAQLFEAHKSAYKNAVKALENSCKIYVDTQMIMAGVNKTCLKSLGVEVCNFVHDKEVVETAKKLGITRSICGINKAAKESDFKIFIIGNAPTALVRICELAKENKIKPDLVIGVPVGFVGAAESKEMLKESGLSYMLIRGRKGGSTVAVAILNSILYDIIKR